MTTHTVQTAHRRRISLTVLHQHHHCLQRLSHDMWNKNAVTNINVITARRRCIPTRHEINKSLSQSQYYFLLFHWVITDIKLYFTSLKSYCAHKYQPKQKERGSQTDKTDTNWQTHKETYSMCINISTHPHTLTQHSEYKSVCKMSVQRQFHHVASKTKGACGLYQAGEDVTTVKEINAHQNKKLFIFFFLTIVWTHWDEQWLITCHTPLTTFVCVLTMQH